MATFQVLAGYHTAYESGVCLDRNQRRRLLAMAVRDDELGECANLSPPPPNPFFFFFFCMSRCLHNADERSIVMDEFWKNSKGLEILHCTTG